MYERWEPGRRVIFGDSIRDVAGFLRETPSKWSRQASQQSGGSSYGNSWDFGVGYKGAWELAHNGWSQGAADLHTNVQGIEPDAVLPELKFDMGGERVDIGRFLSGDPACMITHGRRTAPKPVVHLIVNGSASASVSAKDFAAYGAALLAVIDTLENSGRRVHLDIAYTIDINRVRLTVGWNVKEAADHCDLSAIAFAVAHPAAFRRIGFALYERSPSSLYDWSYGYPTALEAGDLKLMDAEGAFVLPGVGRTGTGAGDVMARVITQVNEAAGEEIISAA